MAVNRLSSEMAVNGFPSEKKSVLSAHNIQSSSYIEMLENFRKRRDEWTRLYPAMDQLGTLFPQLRAATKCISVGAGLAQYDTEFVKRCMPNIECLEVIEADPTCADFLRKNLSNMLARWQRNDDNSGPSSKALANGYRHDATNCYAVVTNGCYAANGHANVTPDDLSDAGVSLMDCVDGCNGDERGRQQPLPTIRIYEGLVQDWSNSLDATTYAKADALIGFHVLYYLTSDERKAFFDDCFRRWLKPEGLAFFVLISDQDRTNLLQNLYRELNLCDQLEIDDIKREIRDLNLEVAHEHPYCCALDLSDLDQSSIHLLQTMASEAITDRQILDAVDKVSPTGKGKYFGELIAVRSRY